MKYYSISFPGEFGQHVEEIWNEQQILNSYWTYWCSRMLDKYKSPHPDITQENCILDWTIVYWAMEVPKPDWITNE